MQKINFSQVREDPRVDLFAVNKFDNPDILMIGSGGCTLFTIMQRNFNTITVVDGNESQLFLIEMKIEMIRYFIKEGINGVLQALQGELPKEDYDHFLLQVKSRLTPGCYDYFSSNRKYLYNGLLLSGKYEKLFKKLVASKYDFDTIFSRENLIKKFGNDAVTNSFDSFSDHFRKVFENLDDSNYLFHSIVHNHYDAENLPLYFKNMQEIVKETTVRKIFLEKNTIENYLYKHKKKYDVILTSNVTDWMQKNRLSDFVKLVYDRLNPGGYAVFRKLNGDYNLKENVGRLFTVVDKFPDTSYFYQEVIIGFKAPASSV